MSSGHAAGVVVSTGFVGRRNWFGLWGGACVVLTVHD